MKKNNRKPTTSVTFAVQSPIAAFAHRIVIGIELEAAVAVGRVPTALLDRCRTWGLTPATLWGRQ